MVNMPDAIKKINSGMPGVDLSDWKTQRYRIAIKGKKWYFCLFSHMLDVAIVNAHELYKIVTQDEKKMDLLDFRTFITTCLMKEMGSVRPGHSSRVSGSSLPKRLRVNDNHVIQRTTDGKQRKCMLCKRTVRKEGAQCDRGIHVECFSAWHAK